jgi:hypothetical protein
MLSPRGRRYGIVSYLAHETKNEEQETGKLVHQAHLFPVCCGKWKGLFFYPFAHRGRYTGLWHPLRPDLARY